jgi:hypothetical protein
MYFIYMDIATLHSNIQQITKSYGLNDFVCQININYTQPNYQSYDARVGYVSNIGGKQFVEIQWTCIMPGVGPSMMMSRPYLDIDLCMEILNGPRNRFSGGFKIPIDDTLKSRVIENIREIAIQIRGIHMPVVTWPDATEKSDATEKPDATEKYDSKFQEMLLKDWLSVAQHKGNYLQDLKAVHNIDLNATGPIPPKVIKDISKAINDELMDEFDPPIEPGKRKLKLD